MFKPGGLVFKLVLGFTLVTAISLFIVAFFTQRSTSREFTTYVEHSRTMQEMMAQNPMMQGTGPGMMGGPGMGPMMGQGSAGTMMGGEAGPAAGQDALDQAERDFRGRVNRALWIAGSAALGVGVLLGLVLASQVVSPLRRLTTAAVAISRGDLSRRVPVAPIDRGEVADLGRAFNAMAEALERDQRLRRQLVADISHELRTPLASIQAHVEAMLDGVLPANQAGLSSVKDDVLLLNRLLTDLRDLALAESGRLQLQRSPLDLGQLVHAQVEKARLRAEAAEIDLSAQVPPEPVIVAVDPQRATQVLNNLLDNALRYTPSRGKVTVKLEWDASEARLSVADTGVGIAPEDLPHIFDRFYRADRSRTRGTGGTGLGLAIVKGLVETHGGRVSVESAPGKGSTFTVTLPASAGP